MAPSREFNKIYFCKNKMKTKDCQAVFSPQKEGVQCFVASMNNYRNCCWPN